MRLFGSVAILKLNHEANLLALECGCVQLCGEGFLDVNWDIPRILMNENGEWVTYLEQDPNCKEPLFKYVLVDLENGDKLIWEECANRKLGNSIEPKFLLN